jgi:hypothetical protein
VNALSGNESQIDDLRIDRLLTGKSSVPSQDERLALAKVAGLSSPQAHLIETAVDEGQLPLIPTPPSTPFSTRLTELLARLKAAGITQKQLAARTAPLGTTDAEMSQTPISDWRLNKKRPTQAALRSLVRGIEQCHDKFGRPLVLAEEIQQLVTLAGFTMEDISATTHDIVARINDETRLKPLLAALRNAADLNVPMNAVDSIPFQTPAGVNAPYLWALLEAWESEGKSITPNPEQARELLARYNRLLHDKGEVELSPEEIERVVEVVQRDRAEGSQMGFRKRAHEHRPRTARRIISSDFDDSPSR